jgi:glucose/mannose-6-phosphate isomerase
MTSSVLDDERRRREVDRSDMLAAVAGLPDQCSEAWQAAQELELLAHVDTVERIVVCGMGGSAIAGDIWRALLQRECSVPVFNIRGYDLPPFVDERTLVIFSSFSGETEETISAFAQALTLQATKLVITTGGRLLAMARANGVPAFTFQYKGEPRAALGWSLMPLLALSQSLGFMQGIGTDVQEAISVMRSLRDEIGVEQPSTGNAAKQMALRLHEKLPVVYGAGPLTEVAHRWKTQLNESAKVWSFYEELPEIHHNAIIGYGLPKAIAAATVVVFLESADLVHPRVRLRYEFTRRLLEEARVDHTAVSARGRSGLAQVLSLTLFGDYVSAYLALLYEVDPTPTTVIDELKRWLAER